MNLEDDLKRALGRQEPPAGFADRVMERVAAGDGPQPATARPRRWLRAAAASLLLAGVLGGYASYKEEQRRGELAKEQVLTAMRIAGEKVRYAQQEVHEIGSHD